MKLKNTILLALTFAISIPVFSFAETLPTDQNITLDGNKVEIQGYNIDGNNYFKLRDVAALLADSDVSFNVSFNSEKNAVEITRNENYKKLDTDLLIKKDNEVKSQKSYQKVYLDEELTPYDVYLINGNNYFKLRDLGKTLGFYVDFNDDTNTVILKTEKLDAKDLINRTDVKFRSFFTSVKENPKMSLKDKSVLNTEDFIKPLTTITLTTTDESRYAARIEYDKESGKMELTPLMYKIRGSLYFTPYIKLAQDDKTEYYDYKGQVDLNDLLKDFNKDKPFSVTLGYYLDNEKKSSEDFRAVSTLDFN